MQLPAEVTRARQADDVGIQVHVGTHGNNGVDAVLLLESSHQRSVKQAAIDNQHLHHVAPYGLHQPLDQLIENGTLVPPAGNHPSPYHEEEIQLSIQMHQADQFIATAKLITRVGAIDLLAFRRGIMCVESEQVRALVPVIAWY